MKQTLFRHLVLYTRSSLSPEILKPLPNANKASLASLSALPALKLRFLSSKTDSFNAISTSVPESNSAQTQKEQSSIDVEDISNEELKRRIQKYFEGDEEAIPSIFEAILKRKLAGKHDESDDELMEEFQHKPGDDVSDKEFESDEDYL
ncbi:hypothetical protein U1Q18_027767 [Sarracenia purpurea var. burkii]